MEIRDVLHGSILIHPAELPIIDSRYFQRLRQIKQLGFAEFSYPSATHNRYIHSLGCMHVASQAFDSIFSHGPIPSQDERPPASLTRFRDVVRLAALLHDIGHGPLSHTTETAMGDVRTLGTSQEIRKATHEDYTLKIILDSELSRVIEARGASHGFGPEHVASLIYPESQNPELAQRTADFFVEKVDGQAIDFRPILKQLISSELDADRMDYLRRDSLHAGVSYGHFDFNWLLNHLSWNIKNEKCIGLFLPSKIF
jgi:HD superfamily phosphohydrolase